VGTDFAYQLSLNEVCDSAATLFSSFFVTTAYVAADPAAANGNCITLDMRPVFNLTAGTARDARTVSAQVRVYSLAPALNLTGSIQTAIHRTAPYTPRASGAGWSFLAPSIPTINGLHPAEAIVNVGDGVYCNYVPSDEDDFAFLATNINTNVRHPNSDDCAFIVVVGQGLPTDSKVRLEIDINFEVIPYPESSLAGFEKLGFQPSAIPALDVEYVLRNYKMYGVIRNGRSYSVVDKPERNNVNRKNNQRNQAQSTAMMNRPKKPKTVNSNKPKFAPTAKEAFSIVNDMVKEAVKYSGTRMKGKSKPTFSGPKNSMKP